MNNNIRWILIIIILFLINIYVFFGSLKSCSEQKRDIQQIQQEEIKKETETVVSQGRIVDLPEQCGKPIFKMVNKVRTPQILMNIETGKFFCDLDPKKCEQQGGCVDEGPSGKMLVLWQGTEWWQEQLDAKVRKKSEKRYFYGSEYITLGEKETRIDINLGTCILILPKEDAGYRLPNNATVDNTSYVFYRSKDGKTKQVKKQIWDARSRGIATICNKIGHLPNRCF